MEGFLLINKPAGITSHDVVARVRRLTGEKRVGHAGTLDPFATGLLIVGVGRAATREMKKLVGLDKTYEATFVLGATSDTDDREGCIQPAPLNLPHLLKEACQNDQRSVGRVLEMAIQRFVGEIDQIPPTYSAIKIGGKKMYEEARKGRPVEAKARRVTIYSFAPNNQPQPPPERLTSSSRASLLEKEGGVLEISVTIRCSSGTYIRALARDLGAALGGGGYVKELHRTTIGPFSVSDALTLPPHLTHPHSPLPLIPISQFLARL